MTEITRFREWAKGAYRVEHPFGEWECSYDSWNGMYGAVLDFTATHPFEEWSDDELRAILYAIARDNESQYISQEIRREHPELLVPLAKAAIRVGERDDRWQLAEELGQLGR